MGKKWNILGMWNFFAKCEHEHQVRRYMVTLLVKQTSWRPVISNNLTPLNFKIKISLQF